MVGEIIPILFFYVCLSLIIGYNFPILTGKWSVDAEHAFSILLAVLCLPIFLVVRVLAGYRIPWNNDTPLDATGTIIFNLVLIVLIFPIPFMLLSTPSKFLVLEAGNYQNV